MTTEMVAENADVIVEICGYPVHPAANIFPMLDEERLKELAQDIATNGQQIKIQLFEGQIIDGRNRATACEIAGVDPQFENVNCPNPYWHVWSLNGNRRDMSDIQRGVIYLMCESAAGALDAAKKDAEERRRAAIAEKQAGNSNAVKTDAQIKSAHLFSNTDPFTAFFAPAPAPVIPVAPELTDAQRGIICLATEAAAAIQPEPVKRSEDRSKRSTAIVAKKANVGRATLEKSRIIVNSGKANAQAVASGTAKPTAVLRQISHAKKLENIAALPTDKYRVIYADPPWQYNDTQGGSLSESYGAAEKHYPTMSLSELTALQVGQLSTDDAVLFLWATSPLLPESLKVVDAWGFKYKAAFIWDKVKHNMGHYNSVRHELLLICTKGSCTPDTPKLFDSVQSIERTDKHSEKPEEFRAIIDELYPQGNRIELFRRGDAPNGWSVWGNETNEVAV